MSKRKSSHQAGFLCERNEETVEFIICPNCGDGVKFITSSTQKRRNIGVGWGNHERVCKRKATVTATVEVDVPDVMATDDVEVEVEADEIEVDDEEVNEEARMDEQDEQHEAESSDKVDEELESFKTRSYPDPSLEFLSYQEQLYMKSITNLTTRHSFIPRPARNMTTPTQTHAYQANRM